MAANQQLADDVWSYTDAPAPKVSDCLNQIADFLSAVGFKKTLKALEKEAKGDGFEIDNKAWKKAVADASAPNGRQRPPPPTTAPRPPQTARAAPRAAPRTATPTPTLTEKA
jgi:hypothetical protein